MIAPTVGEGRKRKETATAYACRGGHVERKEVEEEEEEEKGGGTPGEG